MSKIASKIIAIAIALLIAVGFLVTGAYLQTSKVVHAATEPASVIDTKVIDRVEYGKSFTVGQTGASVVTVKTPGGTYAKDGEGHVLDTYSLTGTASVTATQVGVYEIIYSSAEGKYASYTYKVECYMDREYKLIVDGNGGSIPTYREVNDEFALPSAELYYYDEDDEAYLPDRDTEAEDIKCLITDPAGTTVTVTKTQLDAGYNVDAKIVGKYFITYMVNMANGENLESIQFDVQVQDSFEDTEAPTMTINGVARNASVNTAYTVTSATVADNSDGSRVRTTIEVKHDYGDGMVNVPEVAVDQTTGYALIENGSHVYYKAGENGARYAYDADGKRATTTNVAEAAKAIFDNDTFMTFYPTEEGTYEVSYAAEDSSKNAAAPYSYTITVSDTTAPTFEELDSSLIPMTWGLSVKKIDTDASTDAEIVTERVGNTNILFPMPVLSDNGGSDGLSVRFRMTRASDSKTIFSFTNIYGTEPSSENSVKANDVFGEEGRTYYFFRYWESDNTYTVAADGKITGEGIADNAYSLIRYDETKSEGFFNFNLIADIEDNLGAYTVSYTARDAKNNSATRSYDITLRGEFVDDSNPTVTFDAPDYFIFRDYETEQSVTDVRATDVNDSTRLSREYYFLFNTTIAQPNEDGDLGWEENNLDTLISTLEANGNAISLSVTGTTTATLEKTDGVYEFTAENEDGDDQTVSVDVANYPHMYVALRATDSAGNVAYKVEEVPVVDGTDSNGKLYTPTFATNGYNTANGKVGEQYNFGSFSITYATAADRNYTGFELYVQRVKDSNGKDVDETPLTRVSFETYSDNRASGTNMIHVDNIRFTPDKAGTYMVVARGFHVSGVSNVKMSFVTVDPKTTGGNNDVIVSSLGTDLEYNQTVSLQNYTVPEGLSGDCGVLRSITGGRFTLMGTEFTAKATTNYTFENYVFQYKTGANAAATTNSLVEYRYADDTTGVYSGKKLAKEADGSALLVNESRNVETFTSTFTDSQTATFRLIGGAMPTYAAKGAYVLTPNISASSVNGNATSIVLTITDPDGNTSSSANNNGNVVIYDKDDTAPAGYTETMPEGNQFLFKVTKDGTYTLTYTATLNNTTTDVSYEIKVGDVIAPTFDVTGIGTINRTNVAVGTVPTASVGDTFGFASINNAKDNVSSSFTYSKVLYDPSNNAVMTVNNRTSAYSGTEPYTFTTAGRYRVVYTVTDEAGNVTTKDYYITVNSTSSGSISSGATATLAVVLIIVGVIIIAGVIIYLIRFRKRKSTK